MISCIVLSHGQIALALVEACKKIIGECESLYALSCEGLTRRGLYEKITHLIESENLKDGLFILVSLRGGSCWNVASKIAMEREKVQLISGLNLPMILSFITKKNNYRFEELGEVLIQDSVRGIARFIFKR